MFKYTFTNGDVVTSKLPKEEMLRRMNRLDNLRVLTEGYLDDPDCPGDSICRKAIAAYHKTDNFTGIIRLSFYEKDWLSYLLESDMLDDEDIATIKFYLRQG